MTSDAIFTPFLINNVQFKNRLVRSSVGGRTANFDGTVTDVWKNFERRFADGGVGGIISTTFHVNEDRVSPLQYPSIARDRYLPYLAKYIAQIKRPRDGSECKYIIQIGDPGYCTYTSLFPEPEDAASSSFGFDPVFGYNNTRKAMSVADIEKAIENFALAAQRVRKTGADGVEITATKGYLIHQFLNPGYNSRTDEWGGSPDNRFRFLERTVRAVRDRVGRDFLLGIRLSGTDFNYVPLLLMLFRLPSILRSREAWMGNEMEQMLVYAKRLRDLGVDYLHVVSGYGFPNPHDVPGKFPYDEVKIFFNSTRHLSFKAWLRCALLNLPPAALMRWVLNLGWVYKPAINLEYARRFKQEVGLPVIANGGFQERDTIQDALASGGCDMVSMARALIANPDLPRRLARGEKPAKPCTHCNRCVGRTGTSPLGCYEPARFNNSTREMMLQIMEWNQPDPV
jgi:2,4-dienoyl-CoA reductase-like NADH-dependent reductase (Old Yellow Enzyme family)